MRGIAFLYFILILSGCTSGFRSQQSSSPNSGSGTTPTILTLAATTQTYCQITQSACANGSSDATTAASPVGTFTDTWNKAATNAGACLQRAADIHAKCANPQRVPTTATFFRNGFPVQSSTVGSYCQIMQTQCTNGNPNATTATSAVGTFNDTWSGAGSNQSACLQRASDIHAGCANPNSVPTSAKYFVNGALQASNFVGGVCLVSQARCPNNPAYVGTINDTWAQASENSAACMQRAAAFHAACGNGDDVPSTATFYQDGNFVARNTVGNGFNPWKDEPYVIGAWFFGAWSNANWYQSVSSLETVGRFDPWGGIRDTYKNPSSVPDNDGTFVPRRPLLGFYDQLDQRAMDANIMQAAAAGLSYFAFYWYWKGSSSEEDFTGSAPLYRFLSSPNKSKLKFMLALMPDSVSLSDFQNKMVPLLVERYISDPDYLRTADGRPIVNIWTLGLSASDEPAGLQFLRSYIQTKLGVNPFFTAASDKGQPFTSAFDGQQCFQQNIGPQKPADDYNAVMANWSGAFSAQVASGQPFIPCTLSNFDPRPWMMVQPQAGYSAYFANGNPSNFQNNLNQVRQFLDANSQQTAKMLTIYAWNEWGEGGNIEPDTQYGTGYVDAVRSAFSLNARATDPGALNLAGTYSAPGGSDPGLSFMITSLFQDILARSPTADELMYWQSTFSYSGTVTHDDFVNSLLNSVEFTTKLASLPDNNSVTQAILTAVSGQSVTSSQVYYWQQLLGPAGTAGLEPELLQSYLVRSLNPLVISTTSGMSLQGAPDP